MIWLVLTIAFVATLVFGVSLGKAAAFGDRGANAVDLDDAALR